MKIKPWLCYLVFILSVLISQAIFANIKPNNIKSILKNIENVTIEKNIQMNMTMDIYRGTNKNRYLMTLWAKKRNYVLRIEKPIVDKGTIFLVNKDDCWIYYPQISKTIKTSKSQRLMGGDFSLTDIITLNLLDDYQASIISINHTELINTLYYDEDIEKVWSEGLILEAIEKENQKTIYPKIRVFINPDGYPVREEFYTISGRLLGILQYKDYQNIEQKMKPRRIIMRSALNKNNYTEISNNGINDHIVIPDIYYTVPYMKTLSISQ